METFTVRFGTPRPVPFRECDGEYLDLDLEARVAVNAVVSDYDRSQYPDEEAVRADVRESVMAILARCFQDWPEGTSVVRGAVSGVLTEKLNAELARRGITATTEIMGFKLTEESESLYQKSRELIGKYTRDEMLGWDHALLRENTGQGGPLQFRPDDWGNGGRPDPGPAGMMPMGMFVDAPAPEPEIRNGPGDKYCRLCGEKRPENARFCPGCGAKFG